jgi:opacity protein-like surface antigen
MKINLKAVALSGVALGMFVGAANAADAVVTSSDWTGFYIGVGGGGSFTFSDTNAVGYGLFMGGGEGGTDEVFVSEDADGDFTGEEFGYFSTNADLGLSAGSYAAIGSGRDLLPNDQMVSAILAELNEFMGSAGDADGGAAGAFARGQIGFDYQMGSNLVFGLDATYNLGKTEIGQSASNANGYSSEDDGGEAYSLSDISTDLSIDSMWTAGARLGFLSSESTLLFVSGGYASANAELSADYDSVVGGEAGGVLNDPDFTVAWNASASESDWMSGYYLGAGVETLLTDSISVRVEYRYTDLGSIEVSKDLVGSMPGCIQAPCGGYAAAGVSAEADVTMHAIAATINWRF